MRIVALLCLFAIGASGQVVRNLRYNGLSGEMAGTCSVSYEIHGLVPAPGRGGEATKGRGGRGGRGGQPVALYLPGTNEPFDSRAGTAYITRMEALGFAAFIVAYPNHTDGGCPAITAKAACMFTPTQGSAIAAIAAAVPRADLTRIVTAGISQGAQLAVISANDNTNIKAAWAIGVGNILSLGSKQIPMQGCMNASAHTLGSMQIFAANAADDGFFDIATVNDELKGVTGNTDCSHSFHNPNGSGCETIPLSAFLAGSGHAYPFSDYQHWSQDSMIDWGLIHVSQWLCDMVGCPGQRGK